MDADKVKEIEVEQVDNGFRVRYSIEESYQRQMYDKQCREIPGQFEPSTRHVYKYEVYTSVEALCARLLGLFKSKRAKK